MIQWQKTHLTNLAENRSSVPSAHIKIHTHTPAFPAPGVQVPFFRLHGCLHACLQKQLQKKHINTFPQRPESKKADQLRRGGDWWEFRKNKTGRKSSDMNKIHRDVKKRTAFHPLCIISTC